MRGSGCASPTDADGPFESKRMTQAPWVGQTAQSELAIGATKSCEVVKKDDSRDHLDRCEKISREFVVTGRNGSKVLNFIEEALDEVALAVKCETQSRSSFGWI
jgi:hypothetical protein